MVTADSHLYGALTVIATFGGSGNITVDGLFTWGYGNSPDNAVLQGVNGQGSLTALGGTDIWGLGSLRDSFRFINPAGQTVRWGTLTNGNLQLATQGQFENYGTLKLERAGRMQSGADGSAFHNFGSVEVLGSGLSGFETAVVDNIGTIEGAAGSLLRVHANQLTLGSDSVVLGDTVDFAVQQIRYQFDGRDRGAGYPLVNATGSLSFGGSLIVETIGFAPYTNEAFTLLHSDAALSGSFSGLQNGATITDNQGNVYRINYFANDVVLTTVSSINAAPTAHAGGPYSVNIGGPVTFDASASVDPEGDPLHYSWDLNGDGQFGDAVGFSPTLTWNQLAQLNIHGGVYEVRVRVDDGPAGHSTVSEATSLTVTRFVYWDGEGPLDNWNDPINWSGDFVPGLLDDVVINLGNNDFTVTHAAGSHSVRSLITHAALHVTGGELTIADDSTLLAGLTVTGATFGSGGVITAHGPTIVNNGSLKSVGGQGSLLANGGGTLGGLSLQNGFHFTNAQNQTITWSAHIGLDGASSFTNAGTMLLTNDSYINGAAASLFHNTATGKIIKTGGSTAPENYNGASFFIGHIINDGIIQVDVGTLAIGFIDTVVENHGSIIARAAEGQPLTTLWLLSQVTSDGSIDADRVRFLASTSPATTAASMTGSYQASVTEVVSGTANLSGTVLELGNVIVGSNSVLDLTGASFAPGATTLPSLTLNGGTLITDEDLTVTGEFRWVGTLQGVNGQGSLTVLSDMTLNGTYFVRDFHLINAGNAVWTAGSVQFYGESAFSNTADARFEIQFDGTFGSFDGNCIRFQNDGTLLKTAGTGVTFLNALLYNNGTVDIQQGQIQLSCGYVQTSPTPPPDGVIYPPGTGPIIEVSGDTTLPSGEDPPTFSTFTQTVTGLLIEQISGHTDPGQYGIPGIDYGQLIVTGNVSLAGSLQVQLRDGFVPLLGDEFMVIDNRGDNSIDGTFLGLNEGAVIVSADGVHTFTISYVGGDGNDLVLTYAGRSFLQVQIDIKPGDTTNPVNLASSGVIAVAILTTADFNATTVNGATVQFAGAFASHFALEDVDGDGDGVLDMILHFQTRSTNLRALYEALLIDDINADGVLDSSNQELAVTLTGQTSDEQEFEGADSLELFLAGKNLRDLLKYLADSGAI